jgi:hypothetical protein
MTAALRAEAEDLSKKGEVGRKRVLEMHDADRNAAALLERIARP